MDTSRLKIRNLYIDPNPPSSARYSGQEPQFGLSDHRHRFANANVLSRLTGDSPRPNRDRFAISPEYLEYKYLIPKVKTKPARTVVRYVWRTFYLPKDATARRWFRGKQLSKILASKGYRNPISGVRDLIKLRRKVKTTFTYPEIKTVRYVEKRIKRRIWREPTVALSPRVFAQCTTKPFKPYENHLLNIKQTGDFVYRLQDPQEEVELFVVCKNGEELRDAKYLSAAYAEYNGEEEYVYTYDEDGEETEEQNPRHFELRDTWTDLYLDTWLRICNQDVLGRIWQDGGRTLTTEKGLEIIAQSIGFPDVSTLEDLGMRYPSFYGHVDSNNWKETRVSQFLDARDFLRPLTFLPSLIPLSDIEYESDIGLNENDSLVLNKAEVLGEQLRLKVLQSPLRGIPGMALFLAELPETFRSFIDHFKLVIRLCKAFKNGNLKSLTELLEEVWQFRLVRKPTRLAKTLGYAKAEPNGSLSLKALANVINNEALFYKFGIAPFVDELKAIVTFLQGLDGFSLSESRKRRHRTHPDNRVVVDVVDTPVDIPLWHSFECPKFWDETETMATVTLNGQLQVQVEYGCNVSITNPVTAFLASAGITNPLQVLWELVPLSFVIDWFVNVGDALTYADLSDRGIQIYDEYFTYTYFFKGTGTVELTENGVGVLGAPSEMYECLERPTLDIDFVSVDRHAYQSKPLEVLLRAAASRDFENFLSLSKSLTALQLAMQRLIK